MYYNWTTDTNTEELKIVCNLIKNGELVIFPTETVYGIGANALDSNAVNKIFIAKGRPSDNPLIVHIANKSTINEIAKDITEVEQKLIDSFMPGPFTIILKRKDCIPSNVSAGLDTVAIRMPDNIIAKAIITYAGVPIAAPSANISGRPSGTRIEDIRKELEGKVSAIIDGGETNIGLESTVVKVVNGVPVILRPGKITPEEIKKVVGTVAIDPNVFEKPKENTKVESPGMKYRHYAPKGELTIVEGDPKKVAAYINEQTAAHKSRGEKTGIIGTSEMAKKYQADSIKIAGSRDDEEAIARQLYTFLREFDDEDVAFMYSEAFDSTGMGQAIMNRLLKAAGHKVVNV